MYTTVQPLGRPAVRTPRRPAPLTIVVALLLAAVTIALGMLVAFVWAPLQDAAFAPGEADGAIGDGQSVTLADDHLPAIAGLDPALWEALRAAEADAALDGVEFAITSGWRSAAYQQWLLDRRIQEWGDEAAAREYVATPERSSHVTGHAVDIGAVVSQLWLIEHGAAYGLCQTYANERWHFELATVPGGTCPEMRPDANG